MRIRIPELSLTVGAAAIITVVGQAAEQPSPPVDWCTKQAFVEDVDKDELAARIEECLQDAQVPDSVDEGPNTVDKRKDLELRPPI